MELPFAGLHQLCGPLLGHLAALPQPQQDVLRVAFGLAAGAPGDRFLVGLAALSLLAEVAENQPVLCLVDDLQWLDEVSAQVLGFVARRLLAERVAIVFAIREPSEQRQLAGLPELRLDGLDHEDASALLATVVAGRLDEHVRERIIAETRGNPLALLELPRDMSAAELAAGFGRPGPGALEDDVPAAAGAASRGHPPTPAAGGGRSRRRAVAGVARRRPARHRSRRRDGRRSTPDCSRSARTCGSDIPPCARRRTARRRRRNGTRCTPRWPTPPIPQLDPDRRAWHRAQATPAPDERVAEELERSAGRALARGGVAAAAAFLETAATLTPEPARRARRLLAAARAKHDAGALDAALELLVAIEAGPVDALQTAEIERLRGEIAFDQRPRRRGARLLVSAARRLDSLDAQQARTTHLEALGAALWAGPDALREAAEAARAAPPGPEPPRGGGSPRGRLRHPRHRGLRRRGAAARAGCRARARGRRRRRSLALAHRFPGRRDRRHGAVGRRCLACPRGASRAGGARHGRARPVAVRAAVPGQNVRARTEIWPRPRTRSRSRARSPRRRARHRWSTPSCCSRPGAARTR